MATCLTALATIAKDQGWVPSTHMTDLQLSITPVLGNQAIFSRPLQAPHMHSVYKHTHIKVLLHVKYKSIAL